MSRAGLKELEQFLHYYSRVMDAIPNARKEALSEAAEAVKAEVDRQIGAQGIQDRHGRVKRWQQVTMGSGGGWARVKPVEIKINKKTTSVETKINKETTSVDITRYLERGHKLVMPGRHGKVTTYAAKKAVVSESTGNYIVPGRLFYSRTKSKAQKIALDAARKVLDRIEDENEFD